MPNIEPFEKHLDQYEDWFFQNRYTYQSEIEVVRRHLPVGGRSLEIVVGSGLFVVVSGRKRNFNK